MKRLAMLQWRIQSPLIGSILMISAPRSPSIWDANGPCASCVRSATTSPSSGPAMFGDTPVGSYVARVILTKEGSCPASAELAGDEMLHFVQHDTSMMVVDRPLSIEQGGEEAAV